MQTFIPSKSPNVLISRGSTITVYDISLLILFYKVSFNFGKKIVCRIEEGYKVTNIFVDGDFLIKLIHLCGNIGKMNSAKFLKYMHIFKSMEKTFIKKIKVPRKQCLNTLITAT